jgi:hypothetical protein
MLSPLSQSPPLNLTTYPQPSIGATQFPPLENTLAGSSSSGLIGTLLRAALPTQQAPQVVSPISQIPAQNPIAFNGTPGDNPFVATYTPQIYSVVLNGLIAGAAVTSIALETNISTQDIAQPHISGDPPAPLPGLPPVQPVPDNVIAALIPLAGGSGGPILTPAAPAPPPSPAPAATSEAASKVAART